MYDLVDRRGENFFYMLSENMNMEHILDLFIGIGYISCFHDIILVVSVFIRQAS